MCTSNLDSSGLNIIQQFGDVHEVNAYDIISIQFLDDIDGMCERLAPDPEVDFENAN